MSKRRKTDRTNLKPLPRQLPRPIPKTVKPFVVRWRGWPWWVLADAALAAVCMSCGWEVKLR